MSLLRVHRRFIALLALVAMLVGVLAPTVAQAVVVGSDRSGWVEVCSVSGMVWVKADTGEPSDRSLEGGGPSSDAMQHCPWCTLHGGVAGLPPSDSMLLPSQRLTDLPSAFYFAPLAATVWAPAQSRAPPLIS